MQFKTFSDLVRNQFAVVSGGDKLFRSSLSGNDLWDLYISSFKAEDNPVFRDPESSTHNCNLDKNFIRRYGNVVSINDNYEIVTMWDVELTPDSEYYLSAKAMSEALKKAKIADVFFETYEELNSLPYEKCNKNQTVFRLGIPVNHKQYTSEEVEKFGVVELGKVYPFHHFYCDLPTRFVDKTGKSQATILSEYRSDKEVFSRGMSDIPVDTLELVRDLITQGSLLDGQTHMFKIEKILPFKKEYDKLSTSLTDNWLWVKSFKLPMAKFRNELIGVLCTELAEGVELNIACQAWNKRVDPANYMKVTAPITQKQIEAAKVFIEENGYVESFDRRFATIDDINVDEILHANGGDGEIKTASIFDNVKPTKSTRHKRSQFDGIEEVSIDKFMKDILPTCTSIEAFLENRMEGNLVTLTTAKNRESKQMFKWNNNFSWTFNGNLAGKSLIKDAVKSAGGNVDGVLRCSISWNEDGRSICDFDLHAIEPDRTEIAFNSYRGTSNKTRMSGFLDVDMINPSRMGVENITWVNRAAMKNGVYKFFIRNYNSRNNTGFKAQIEFDGQVFDYEFVGNAQGDTKIAEVTLTNGVFTIEHKLPETMSSKSLWNLDTNEFHKVNLVSLSPNHWGDNSVGNKHYLFMLEGCKSDVPIRSFHNENLNADLVQHKKVMEVLGQTTMLQPSNKQLCGLGFNATVKDEVILKLSGSFKRTIKVKFNQ
jgi:hypothetical protein